MSALKHTPGPWGVWSSLYEGMGAAVVSGHAPGAELKTIAEVRAYRDACLIAAAPDLLEALWEISQRVARDGGDTAQADRAIMKATGQ